MSAPEVTVHIGPPKTGTTWLQQSVFPSLPVEMPLTPDEIRRLIVFPSPTDFDPAVVLEAIAKRTAKGAQRIVLSDERLAGAPLAGGYDRTRLADRVAECFPSSRILITIREQKSAILSTYKHYVTWNNGSGRFADFACERPPMLAPQFSYDYFDYSALVALYDERFGAAAVRVLPFELRENPDRYAKAIADALSVESAPALDLTARNVGIDDRFVSTMRLVNALTGQSAHDRQITTGGYPVLRLPGRTLVRRGLRTLSRRPRGPSPKPSRLSRKVSGAVAGRFAASNRSLADRTGIDLEAMGYDVG